MEGGTGSHGSIAACRWLVDSYDISVRLISIDCLSSCCVWNAAVSRGVSVYSSATV